MLETSPFDEFGQRRHTLQIAHGTREIVVGVTKINPQHLTITGLTDQWDYGVATTSIPAAQLDLMIRKANDPKNPDHRFAIARFYLAGVGFYDRVW